MRLDWIRENEISRPLVDPAYCVFAISAPAKSKSKSKQLKKSQSTPWARPFQESQSNPGKVKARESKSPWHVVD